MTNLAEFRQRPLLQLEYALATGRSVNSLLKRAVDLHGNTLFNSFLQQTSSTSSPIDWLEHDKSLNANISVLKKVANVIAELEESVDLPLSGISAGLKGKHATSPLGNIFKNSQSDYWNSVTKAEIMPLLKEFNFWLDYIDELELGAELVSAKGLLEFLEQPLFKQLTRLVDVHEIVAANWDLDANVFKNILKDLHASNKEYVQEWLSIATPVQHHNAKTHREYESLYTFMFLSAIAVTYSYKANLWATKRQWNKMGYVLKSDAKPAPVFHYFNVENGDKVLAKEAQQEQNNVGRKISIVYNADEVVGFSVKSFGDSKVSALPILERRIDELEIHIEHNNNGDAFYNSIDDIISMPHKALFKGKDSTKSYYATLLHEMVHWTGHESRCKRTFGNGMESPTYAFEELVAEIGSSFLCSRLGLTKNVRQKSIKYIANWLSKLDDMKCDKIIQDAANLANRASSYIYTPKRDGKID